MKKSKMNKLAWKKFLVLFDKDAAICRMKDDAERIVQSEALLKSIRGNSAAKRDHKDAILSLIDSCRVRLRSQEARRIKEDRL